MILPGKQPTEPKNPASSRDAYENGNPRPQMSPFDNNRGVNTPLQGSNKVFQNPEEIFNNPGKSNHGVIYDSGTDERGVPKTHDPIVQNGPFNKY